MKHFPIKAFSGIETKTDGTDQDRGTLRRADGVLIAPDRALASSPQWAVAWDGATMTTSINAELTNAGATAGLVHFVTITDLYSSVMLVAQCRTCEQVVGAWMVASNGFNSFGFDVPTIAAPSGVYRNKTALKRWYGAWLGNRLFLGNGTDTNLVWTGGALAELGPSGAVANKADPSQFRIPACTSFVMDDEGVIYAAGNASNPLRVWVTEKPTSAFPTLTGVLTNDRSFVDIRPPNPQATAITALSIVAGGVMVHLDAGGCVWIGRVHSASDGNTVPQTPLANLAGARNPNCIVPGRQGLVYLATDFELYSVEPRRAFGYGQQPDRDPQLETWKSSGGWNAGMNRASNAVEFLFSDPYNGRVWIGGPQTDMAAYGLWCHDTRHRRTTGPFYYPAVFAAVPMMETMQRAGQIPPYTSNGSSWVVAAFTSAGSLLYADVGKLGELALDAIGTALGSSFAAVGAQPTPTAGLSCVGVYNSGTSFLGVNSAGNVRRLLTPWAEWTSGSVPGGVTEWYNNAYPALIELAPEDFGSPSREKDFMEVRVNWRRNQRAYTWVFVESDQQTDAVALGCCYPDEEQVAAIAVKGTRLRVRLLFVFFYAAPACLPDITIGYLEGGPK